MLPSILASRANLSNPSSPLLHAVASLIFASLFASFAERYHLDQGEQNLARYLLRLTSEERQMVKKHILSMAAALQTTSKEAAKPKDAAPAKEPHALTDDEWAMVQMHRTAKAGSSAEDGSWDTGA